MNPAFSVVFFTTLIGAAQGLVVVLAVLTLTGADPGAAFASRSLVVAECLLMAGLAASFGHLGRPERAWRAAMMWRTSWLSREVIALPAFIVAVGAWWLMQRRGNASLVLPWANLILAFVLWHCTAMIYACLKFIKEWAHPLTPINFALIGLSSGLLLACTLAALTGSDAVLATTAPAALLVTLAAGAARVAALRRNAILEPGSTLQSATGILSPVLRQTSMGMSAGAFNTREFFHRTSETAVRNIRLAAVVMGFLLPAILVAAAWWLGLTVLYPLAFAVHGPGLVAERWLFFAQARHPQNLYYQVVS